MELSAVLSRIEVQDYHGDLHREIFGVNMDSRRVEQGDVFVAVRGTVTDGHQFIPIAIQKGAAAIVCEHLPDEKTEGVTYVKVADSERAVGEVATAFYGYPSEHLQLVGVTGTNGKTTIATLLYELFTHLGYKSGLCSTVCNYIGRERLPADHTTPDPVTLNRLLGQMVEQGCIYAFMECSSHAIQQRRIAGLRFKGGIFTNLTRDHLDYHGTFEHYRDAKKAFFDGLGCDAFALTNLDDRNGLFMLQNTQAQKRTYSQLRQADFHAKILEMTFEGMALDIDGQEVHVPLVGKFNVSNLLAIYGAALLLGEDAVAILTTLSTLHSVSGRFEAMRSPKGVTAIVDYAHTPDALVNVLNAIGEVLGHRGRVITVCGAGGNRDKGKRPQMAYEAARLSDRVILTCDNPRGEEPQEILNDMVAGLKDDQKNRVLTIVDRQEAIRTAYMLAGRGDVILVAGKGHEDYQEIKGVKHHFDDKEVIQEVFQS